MLLGRYDGQRILTGDYIVFDNYPVDIPGALYWNIFGLYEKMQRALAEYGQNNQIESIGVDTWGASYGLLDEKGRLMEPVYHYRDPRTLESMDQLYQKISQRELFDLTGCQCNRTYTLPQLYSYMEHGERDVLDRAGTLLFLPDLLDYFLCGEISTEETIAGTSALFDARAGSWSGELLERTGIPEKLFTGFCSPGSIKGHLRKSIRERMGGMSSCKVAAVAGHDSASGVLAIPGFGRGKLYISIGTNVSMGVERDAPFMGEEAFSKGFKNTPGFGKTNIVYRDFPAFWLLNQLKSVLETRGRVYSYEDLMDMARQSAFRGRGFDVEDPAFGRADGDICEKIQKAVLENGGSPLQTEGDFVRCIFESIVSKVAFYAKEFWETLGMAGAEVFVINGGTRNTLLMQMLADALHRPLYAGMPQATLVGNLLAQLYALGEVKDLQEIRELSSRSFALKVYEPGLSETGGRV